MNKTMLIIATGCITTICAAQITETDQGIYELKAGNTTMTVNTQTGAKIVSLTLDGNEIIAQHVPAEGFRNNNNDYGSTFWPSPQSVWNWPPLKEYDSDPYTTELMDGVLTAVSGINQKFPYKITKQFSVDTKREIFTIKYTIENPCQEAVSVAPWEISRVPNKGGVIVFDAPIETITPVDAIPSKLQENLVWMEFTSDPGQRKIFADSKGWLAFCDKGHIFMKVFPDLTEADVKAPGETELEVYINNNDTFIELENQGQYVTLQPGEKLEWSVKWLVRPTSEAPVAGHKLANTLKKMVKEAK